MDLPVDSFRRGTLRHREVFYEVVGWTGYGLVMVIVLGSGGCGTSCGLVCDYVGWCGLPLFDPMGLLSIRLPASARDS